MDIQEHGPASDNGAQMADAPATAPQEQEAPRTVPYARFAEVNTQKKAAEAALAEMVESMVQDLPENFRALVPNLAPADKVKWIAQARAAGVFTASAPTASPDPARPISRPDVNIDSLSPLQMMQGGYR